MSEEKVKDTKEIVENTITKEITPEEKVEKMAATENHATKRSISEETEDKPAEKKQKIEEKPAEKPAEKPKFVFGGSSTFSNGFKFNKDMIPSNAKKIKETEEKKEEEPKKETPVFGTFGSSTTFGQGFGLLKEIQKTKENTEEKKKEEAEEKPLLTKLETVENGEENEDIEFNSNTKMYSLTSLKEGWKERGVGPIHLNHNKETDSYRLVIRQRLTFQVLLNLKVVKGIKIFKGFPGSSNSERFVRIVVTVDKQVVQYCMKLNSEDLADKLFEKLESLV